MLDRPRPSLAQLGFGYRPEEEDQGAQQRVGEGEVELRHLSAELRERPGSAKTMGEVKREMVAEALVAEAGNKARAARRLGVPRSTLYRMIERFGLQDHGRVELP